MIEKMEKLHIYCMRNQTSDIMEELLKAGVVQTERTQSMLSEDTAKVLRPGEALDLSQEETLLAELRNSIDTLKVYGSKKGLFSKRPEVSYNSLMDDGMLMDTMKICERVSSIVSEREELNKELKKEEFRKVSYLPWKSLDISAEDMKTRTCGISCYILQGPPVIDDLRAAAADRDTALYAELVSSEQDEQYIAIVYPEAEERSVRDIAGMYGAREFKVEEMSGTFSDNITACEGRITELTADIENRTQELETMASELDKLEMACDAVKVRIQCLSGYEDFMRTDTVDIISGWIPEKKKTALDKRIGKFDCCCEYEKPADNEPFPVLMKNSKLVEPFGAITEMYSLPDSHSIDTNWAIGLFFFIFFGMMLSDAGYGLLLLIGGLGGAKVLDLGDGAKRLMKMIGLCGISTIFWGLMYGSVFGDAIPTVAKTFFGKNITMPMVIDPLHEPMTVLILACALGVVHLFVGMGIKGYILIRQGHVWSAIFDVGLWYIFLIGLPLLLAPAPFNLVGKIMSIVGAAGLGLTQHRA